MVATQKSLRSPLAPEEIFHKVLNFESWFAARTMSETLG